MAEIKRGARFLIWAAVSSKPQANEDERVSLAQQEERGRALAEHYGGVIVDVLRVPGYSRDFYNTVEWVDDMKRQGVHEPAKLMDYINRRAFDVFVCRDSDRFGRKGSLVQEIAGKITDTGAVIFPLASGRPIDKREVLIWATLTGYKAEEDNRKLVEYRHAGMKSRLQRGLPINRPPISHKVIRDERGKAVRLVVNEDMRLFCEDAARLLLEGVGWDDMAARLVALGHLPYSVPMIYRTFHNPIFWGNACYGQKRADKRKHGLWCFDESVELPEGVSVEYNTHEPLLTGTLAEKVKAEMWRRSLTIKGKTRPYRTGIFTGLIICGKCGYNLYLARANNTETSPHYYACTSRFHPRKRDVCQNTKYMRVEKIQEVVTEILLKPLLAGIDLETLLTGQSNDDDTLRQLKAVEAEISGVRQRVKQLIQDRVRHKNLDDIYEEEIRKEGELLSNLQRRQRTLTETAAAPVVDNRQRRAVEDVRRMTLDSFWNQSWTEINQSLFALMGRYRMVMIEGEIVGFTIPETTL
jgi:hypothetical protein